MKNFSKYIAFAFLGLAMASCGDDYNDWANPQTNPQEDAITIPGFTASAADAIDLAAVSEDSVSTFTLSSVTLPEGFELANARIEMTPEGVEGATTTTINAGVEGRAAVADLSDLVVSVYGKRPTARTFDAHVYVNAVKDGQAVLIDAGKINVVATPKAPFIDNGYYLVGDMFNSGEGDNKISGWSADGMKAFAHSDADVYEDPEFTIMFTTTADNQCWKIIPKKNADAGNIWADGVVGTKEDGDESLSGSLVNEGAQAGKIAKAGIYQMTINMMDYTYTLKQIAPEYYLVGAPQGWNPKTMSCLMSAESAMVHSFTTKWTNDANLKIWLGSDFGNWGNAFGTATGKDESTAEGKLKANGGAIVCPEKDAYYTFTADFSTMTYKWTKLANQNPTEFEYVSLIGVAGKWNDGDDIDLKQVAPHNWYLAKQEIPAGGLKIRGDHTWGDGNWGLDKNQKYESKGTLICAGNSSNIPVPAGTYNIYFNDITGAYAFVEVK